MGSILMHLCISEQIKRKYNFNNDFLIGSVLPDIYKRTTMTRDDSHYIEKVVEKGYVYQLPDLKKYVEEHKDTILTDGIILGYYAHLVEDFVWFRYVSGLFTKVKEGEEEQDLVRYRNENFEKPHPSEEYGIEMYKDYANVNSWLIYRIQININEFIESVNKYTNDDSAGSIIKEYCDISKICREGKNAFLSEECIERYIKASTELFELNLERIKNSYGNCK